MDHLSFWRNLWTPSRKKCIEMHKIQIVRFIEINKHFRSLCAVIYFVAYIYY
jgi:hypothetical protein